jgi:hypothetical protein
VSSDNPKIFLVFHFSLLAPSIGRIQPIGPYRTYVAPSNGIGHIVDERYNGWRGEPSAVREKQAS